jgi:uncharacterized protein YbjT (DUF2867 family)
LATTRRSRRQLSSGAPREVGEATRRAILGPTLGRRRGELFGDRVDQALVAGEAEEVIDAVGFAPAHQPVPGKARIGPQHDLHPWPAGADLGDDTFDLIEGTR